MRAIEAEVSKHRRPDRLCDSRKKIDVKFRFVIAAAAAFTVVACGGQTRPSADKSETSTSTSASTASSSEVTTSPAVASGKGDKPTRDFVIGKWGTNGDCALAIDLRADGTSDGPFGKWSYSDGVISFDEEPDFKVNVTVLDENTMESTNEGKTTKMTRCP